MQKLYGVISKISEDGCNAYVIAGDKVINSHYSSSEGWAMTDLGFDGGAEKNRSWQDSISEKYKNLFPRGFELIWIGLTLEPRFVKAWEEFEKNRKAI